MLSVQSNLSTQGRETAGRVLALVQMFFVLYGMASSIVR